MADVELLDSLVSTAVAATKQEIEAKSEPGASASGGSADLFATPTKRRRRQSVPLLASPVGEGVVLEEGEDSQHFKMECDDTACLGCGRIRDLSMSYLDEQAKVSWQNADGRGSWCLACFTVWRTAFSGRHTLRLFERWLQQDGNMNVFHLHLLAWFSLSVEQDEGSPIRAKQLADRVQLLTWLLAHLGIPAAPAVVRLLEEGASPPAGLLDARQFVLVKTNSGLKVGMFEALRPCLAALSQQPFLRSFFNAWDSLPQSWPRVQPFLEPFTGAPPVVPNPPLFEQAVVASGTEAQQPASRLEGRLEVLWSSAIKQLQDFGSDAWTSMKEGALTKMLSSASQLQTEAGTDGLEEVYRSADRLAAGLSATKFFLRTYREHSRMKTVFGKLEFLASRCEPVQELLISDKVKIKPDLSFSMLLLRAGLAQEYLKDHSLKAGVARMIGLGLPGVFAQLRTVSGEDRVKPLLWLRMVFEGVFQNCLLGVEAEAKRCPEDIAKKRLRFMTICEQPWTSFSKLWITMPSGPSKKK